MEIKILGTNHLMKKEEIIDLIKKENPEILCIELCKIREYIYLNNIKSDNINDDSLLGKIGNAIKKKAKQENLEYGSDMYTALQYSIDNKIPYYLIDKNIQEVQSLFQKIPPNEIKGFTKELSIFENQTIKESTVNEQDFLTKLKTNYPISFEILINAREFFMVNNILKVILNNPGKRILIILGKGHVNNIKNRLQDVILK